MSFSLVLLVVAALGVSSGDRSQYSRTVRYDDEVLVRCPTDAPGVKQFILRDDVDLWAIRDGTADVRLKEALFARADISSVCSRVGNVEHLVQQAENATFPKRRPGQRAEWFEEYHDYTDIVNWYEKQVERNPDILKFVRSIGKSTEGRDQPAFHIGKDSSEMKIYFQCQIHAREWISGATCMYVANELIEKYNEGDERVTRLLNEIKFIFVPLVNPDGYAYTWSGSRLWRKNRRENSGSSCLGVDLNRNYPDHWNGGGSSDSPCSDIYHGESEESEVETKNTIAYFRANGPIIGAIDWHSYSQLILRPYGWTSADSPDETQLRGLGDRMRSAILEVNGKTYTNQKSIGLYPTSGTASDWFYGEDATRTNKGYTAAGYTIELRDTGIYGFLLPPDQIIPQGKEIFPAVLIFAEELKENPIKLQ